jgi:hypothetical protein
MEAAGLALAVFSASINCLDGYRKIKDMKEHHGSLKRFKRQLNMENCKFTNTCRILLEGVVPAEHVKILVGGAGWKDPDFQARFEQHLGVETAIAFTGAVEDLHESLQRLSEEVGGLDEKQRVCATERSLVIVHLVTRLFVS